MQKSGHMVLRGVIWVNNDKSGQMVLKAVKWVHNDKFGSNGLEMGPLSTQYKNEVICY